MNRFISTMAVLAVTPASLAQIVVDGTAEKSYGAALAVQNVQTQFGDATQGQIGLAFGSEIDGIFARVEGGVLFVVIAGNLESNFNKLEIFIDAVDGGQNQIRGDNLDVDFNGLNRMGDDPATVKVVEGLTFDAGFSADLWVSATCGGSPIAFYFNYATMPTGGAGTGGYQGSGSYGEVGAVVFKSGFGFGFNNSNIAGVIGGTEIGDGSGVTTGMEIRIPLGAIPGYESGDLKVCAFINGGGHDYLSNQVLGGLGGGSNLAEPRFVNFENIPGDQFFVVSNSGGGNPCPADLDGSGEVNAADLAALLGSWGTAGADLDGDGTTAASDLAALLGSWGACP